MIDEKRLQELMPTLSEQYRNLHEAVDTREMAELIRLAYLGLWAEKYGVPTVQTAWIEMTGGLKFSGGDPELVLRRSKTALAALPKEKP